MADEKRQLFREKNRESIQSPESLNEYLRVTSPGVWILLAAVIVLLIGVAIWGLLGHIDAKTQVAVVAENGETFALVPENAMQAVINNPTITVEGKEYAMTPDILEPIIISTMDMNIYIILAGNLADGDVVYKVDINGQLPDDIYSGSIITESISPASFLLN